MLKSLQWKLVFVFLLLTVSVMMVVGTFLISSITGFYHQDYIKKMELVFAQVDFSTSAGDVEQLQVKLRSFSGRLGIDSYRNYYILDSMGKVLATSNKEVTDLEKSANMIAAMNGKVGKEAYPNQAFMDYALPVFEKNVQGNASVKNVLYIKDDKNALREMIAAIYGIIFRAIFFGLIISVVLGFFLSNTLTTPISRLTAKAESIAQGNFGEKIDVKSNDEIGILTNTFNIMTTRLKENVEEIETQRSRVEKILLHMTDGVVAFDLQGNMNHINPIAKKLLCIPEGASPTFDELFCDITPKISVQEIVFLEQIQSTERRFIKNEMHIRAVFVPFQGEGEKIGGLMAVLQDVTKQEKLEMARREFVSNVSHELKTPITTVQSYIDTIIDGGVEDQETLMRFLRVVGNEAERMSRLVKDLLVLSNLDNQQTRLQKTAFSLKDLVMEVVEKMSLEAKKNEHLLDYVATTEMPQVYGDRDRIEQVIKNIISNAIKYTPTGGKITVYTGFVFNEAYIKVIDNGIGIPKEDLPRIFERFYRVDKARSRDLGGTGLGLSIAREIMEAHGGSIDIRSRLDAGTEVILKLPA